MVTFTELALGRCNGRKPWLYLAAQILSGMVGVLAAHFMFEMLWLTPSANVRTGKSTK